MSLLEPATTAAVKLNTSKGPITIELWAKENPITCRNFLQNCLDGKYNGSKFTKVIKDYLVQIDSINDPVEYNLQDEFNSRIRFNQKGLLASIKQDESIKHHHSVDAWFITVTATPEFNNKYNLFGKLVGESIYNVMKINDGDTDSEGLPLFPVVINSIEILKPYFTDLQKTEQLQRQPPKKKTKLTKQKVKLLYDEEEDEEDDSSFKMKSAHDLLNDKRLSKKTVDVNAPNSTNKVESTDVKISQQSQLEDDTITNYNVSPETADTEVPTTTIIDEENGSNLVTKPSKPLKRDPTIDSDFDPNLDFSDTEFDVKQFHDHKFIATN